MQLPPYLAKGDKVGITAPARWVDPDAVNRFQSALEAEGWRMKTAFTQNPKNQFAGSDRERLENLQNLLDDPGIKAIFCARGGYGSGRLLDSLDLNGFAAHPKWIAGFSDITALHSCILMKIGTAVLHSVMAYTVREEGKDEGLQSMIDILKGKLPEYEIPPDPLNREGRGQGILLGGNLSVIHSLTGTPYQVPTREAILFLEDVDEYLYHLDRMMLNLRMAGMLEHLNGLVIGSMTGMKDNEVPFGKNAYQIIREAAEPYNFPVCFGFPAGHLVPNLALVLGKEVSLEVGPEDCRLNYIDRR